eukprot:6963186-Prymnesium_polylepis.1
MSVARRARHRSRHVAHVAGRPDAVMDAVSTGSRPTWPTTSDEPSVRIGLRSALRAARASSALLGVKDQ